MLVNLKEILEIAERENIAIGMFNATGFDSLQAVIAAAEELNQPVIIAHAEVHNVYNDISMVGPAMVAVAEGKSSEVDGAILKRLESYGYIKKTDDGYIPAIMVMRKNKSRKMPKEIREQFEALRHKATEIATRHYLFCREQIYKEIPKFLKED